MAFSPLSFLFGLLAVVLAVTFGLCLIDATHETLVHRRNVPKDYLAQHSQPEYLRRSVYYPCSGEQCHAWVYMPPNHAYLVSKNQLPHVVVMAHDIGAQKDFNLQPWAVALAEKGLAAFVFDYRHFGASDGEPRNLISFSKQVEDWNSALSTVRQNLTGVSSEKIGLWGMGLSAGEVLQVAAQSEHKSAIGAVVSLNPILNCRQAARTSTLKHASSVELYTLVGQIARDIVRRLVGKPASYVPIYGRLGSGEPALLLSSDIHVATDMLPASQAGGWKNFAPAGFALSCLSLSPMHYAEGVAAPTFVIFSENDDFVSFSEIERLLELLGSNGQSFRLNGSTHFDVYSFRAADVAKRAVPFLAQHLGVAPKE